MVETLIPMKPLIHSQTPAPLISSHISKLQTSVLLAFSEAPALLTLPRGSPDALGNNNLRAMLPWPFFRSWWWG